MKQLRKLETLSKSAAYDRKRKEQDLFYLAVKNARSTLSSAVRRALKTPDATSERCEELTGVSFTTLMNHFHNEAAKLGLALAENYGRDGQNLEVDHLNALCGYQELAEAVGAEAALRVAFNIENLTIQPRGANRDHKTKSTVRRMIGETRMNRKVKREVAS